MDVETRLRDARERKGLTLADIATKTNISLPVLDAIDRGNLDRLPGGLFTRAYLRAYAGEVGLDPEETIAAYHAGHDPHLDDDQMNGLRRRYAGRRVGLNPRMQAVVFAIGLVMVLVFGLILSRPAGPVSTEPVPGVVPAIDESSPPSGPGRQAAQRFSRRSVESTTRLAASANETSTMSTPNTLAASNRPPY